jgi:predicted NBD/HSP70 family sugar kinase
MTGGDVAGRDVVGQVAAAGPAGAVSIRAAGLRVGLDVGGTKVLGVLLDGDVVRHRVRLPTRPGADGVVGTAEDAVHELYAAAGAISVDAVGMGLPGVVDPRTGTVSYAVNLGIDLSEVPVGRLLSDRLGVPVTVENDLNCAALGASDALGLPDMAFLALGTGVAAGLVLDGRLRRGRTGAAGEVGHLPYRPDGAPCACGQRGCLELYASGSALDAAWPGPAGTPAPERLVAAAAAGDSSAAAVLATFADAVATAVRVLVLTCDVADVVLGGGVAQLGRPLLDAVAGAVVRQTSGSAFLRSLGIADRLRLAPAGVPLGAIGAALATRGDADRLRRTAEVVG